ncbi:threonine dehydratase [Saccharomonospora marina XMU15]|uniref:threonine ammonia-lyase n=1 Tax=Saccharomonospora marina XMU15 TaxID=882083 RepID=H5X1I9_9PSEU|nr:threonine dehydratase [Saccharomonospora marina XMU15]
MTVDDIRAAAARIDGAVVRTPLLPATWAASDRPLWLKPESLQPIGAFKLRGAYNAVARLDERVRRRGVVTYSSGNHAQAVAYAARAFGVEATIVMPDVTPQVKIDNTRGYGAEVVLVPIGQREAAANEIVADRGAVLVPPFDHPDVVAGQGTIGAEIVADLAGVDAVLVPVSGGGLASGIGTAVKALSPRTKVIAVEPELSATTTESLSADAAVDWPVERRARTIADGLRTQPSEFTFAHLREVLDGVVTVSEEQIRSAMAVLARKARLVAEPSGAVSLAAYLSRADQLPSGSTVAVISGGNVDPRLLADVLAERA